jgi:hypothetical protein
VNSDDLLERRKGWVILHVQPFFFGQPGWWDSPCINHFVSADTIVSNLFNPQDLNRYSYVLNNPVRYRDPMGYMVADEDDGGCYICEYPPGPVVTLP